MGHLYREKITIWPAGQLQIYTMHHTQLHMQNNIISYCPEFHAISWVFNGFEQHSEIMSWLKGWLIELGIDEVQSSLEHMHCACMHGTACEIPL